MTPEQWKRISAVFAEAVVLSPADRSAFLDMACGDSPDVRREVDQLLVAASTPAAQGLDGSPVRLADGVDADAPGTGEWVGRRIGAYEITAEVGRGGMGIVYRATDTRLNRVVAIKALPAMVAGDPQRKARLRTEASAAASLSHPGIAAVYALEEFGDDLFIVSEYVDGRSLRQAIADGPMRLASVVEITLGAADALAAAHRRGIVHRDLKPDNVLLPRNDGVKIVDFGLARFLDGESGTAPTAARLTRTGVLLGTPAYMSPEQIRNALVDERTDVFALGVIAFECATGVHPFAARTVEATMARVLEDDVDVSALDACGMGVLAPVVARAVAKDPAKRYPSAREMAAALEAVKAWIASSSGGRPHPTPTGTPALPSMVTTSWRVHQVVVAAIALLMLWPLSVVRPLAGLMTRLFFVAMGAAVFVIALRMNQLFLSFVDVGMLREQRLRWRHLLRAADLVFCGALALAAVMVADAHLGFASLFGATALGLVAAALIIEPTTTKTAFGE